MRRDTVIKMLLEDYAHDEELMIDWADKTQFPDVTQEQYNDCIADLEMFDSLLDMYSIGYQMGIVKNREK
jgi:hypothetical protein